MRREGGYVGGCCGRHRREREMMSGRVSVGRLERFGGIAGE